MIPTRLDGLRALALAPALLAMLPAQSAPEDARLAALLARLTSEDPAALVPALQEVASQRAAASGAVPRLAALLEHWDQQVRNQALWALRQIGPAARPATAAIEARRSSPDRSERHGVARALAELAPDDAAKEKALLPALCDRDPWVQSAALRSCLELGVLGPGVRAAILGFATDADAGLRAEAAKLAPLLSADPPATDAVVKALASSDYHVATCARALFARLELPRDKKLELLSGMVRGPQSSFAIGELAKLVRQEDLMKIVLSGRADPEVLVRTAVPRELPKRTLQQTIEALDAASADDRLLAVQQLSTLQKTESAFASIALCRRLADPDARVLEAALRLLRDLGSLPRPALRDATVRGDRVTRTRAAVLTWSWNMPLPVSLVRDGLADSSPAIRGLLLGNAERLGAEPEALLAAVRGVLKDGDPQQKTTAFTAAKALGARAAPLLPELEQQLVANLGGTPDVVDLALACGEPGEALLDLYARRQGIPAQRVQELGVRARPLLPRVLAWTRHREPYARAASLRALPALEPRATDAEWPAVLAALRERLGDPDADVRATALETLTALLPPQGSAAADLAATLEPRLALPAPNAERLLLARAWLRAGGAADRLPWLAEAVADQALGRDRGRLSLALELGAAQSLFGPELLPRLAQIPARTDDQARALDAALRAAFRRLAPEERRKLLDGAASGAPEHAALAPFVATLATEEPDWLRGALASSDAGLARAAGQALERVRAGHEALAEVLAEQLVAAKDHERSSRLVQALLRLAPAGPEALGRRLERLSDWKGGLLANWLMSTESRDESLIPLLEARLEGRLREPGPVQADALWARIAACGPAGLARIRADGPTEAQRRSALLTSLATQPSDVRLDILSGLDPRTLTAEDAARIAVAASDPDPRVRSLAVRLWYPAARGDASGADLWDHALCHREAAVREGSLRRLASLPPAAKAHLPFVVAALSDPDAVVALAACAVLTAIGPDARAAEVAVREASTNQNGDLAAAAERLLAGWR